MSNLSECETAIGIAFKDKSLLQRALTHPSYVNENPDFPLGDNQRLEFLGDAALDFIAGEYLYRCFPEMEEGELTPLRAALVKKETLARFASQLSLGRYLLLGRGEEESGGREKPSNLCDAFEALVGALYLDQGLEVAKEFVKNFIKPEVERMREEGMKKDAKSLLQEWSQAQWRLTPTYRTVAEKGPDHAKEFTVEVLIGEEVYGRGVGHSKQAAEQEAARAALAKIERDRANALQRSR